jgi:enoyl-CoA hydratase
MSKALQCIEYDLVGNWVRITLNRPERRNALSNRLLAELQEALWEADEDRDVRAVLIRGAGPSFCSGYDLAQPRTEPQRLRSGATRFRGISSIADDVWQLDRTRRAMITLFEMQKPVVAQVHGHCLAGGMDLVMLCDMVVASEDAEFAYPPVRAMGTPPVNMWLYNVPVQWAKRLLLTGDSILGADAAEIGMILEAVPAAELEETCVRLMDRITLIDADVLAVNKRSLNLAMELMGARTLQSIAGELDARGHKSASAQQYVETIKASGVKAANEKRDGPFGKSRVRRSRRRTGPASDSGND